MDKTREFLPQGTTQGGDHSEKKKKEENTEVQKESKLCRAIPGEGMTTDHQPTMCNVAGSCLPCNFCTGQEAVSLGALWKNHGEKENERSKNLGEGEPII